MSPAEPRNLFLQLLTRRSLHEPELGAELFAAVDEEAPAWRPGTWDTDEPLRRTWDDGDVDGVWANWHFYVDSRRPGICRVRVDKLWQRGDAHGTIAFRARPSSIDTDRAVSLFQRLANLTDADYGHLHVLVPDDLGPHLPPNSASFRGGEPRLSVAPWELDKYLPGPFWAMVLGPSYTQLFGREQIASVPAAVVREIDDGRWYVQLTDSIDDHSPAAAQAVVDHLGRDAFYDRSRRGSGRVPQFPHRLAASLDAP